MKRLPYYRVAKIAKQFNIPKQTLDSAVKSGRIPSRETECGLPLVRERDVLEWCLVWRPQSVPKDPS